MNNEKIAKQSLVSENSKQSTCLNKAQSLSTQHQ